MVAITAPTEDELYLLMILDSPDGIDLAEFAVNDTRNPDGCYRLYDYQWRWFACTDTYQIDMGGRNLGKALDVTTPIPTPTGWTAMGDLVVGDEVFDERGEICRVTGAFEVRTNRPCYEVVFSDGSTIIADEDHRWLTWTREDRRNAKRLSDEGRAKTRADRGVRVPRPHLHRDPPTAAVRTTGEIRRTLYYGPERPPLTPKGKRRQEVNHSIDVAAPLQLPHVDLPIHPYVLGAWLGDGTSSAPSITIGHQDAAELISNLTTGSGVKVWQTSKAHELHYRMEFDDGRCRQNGLQVTLRQLGVLNNKHIPASYLRASEDQRRLLLAGIMDTDGWVGANPKCNDYEITLCNERLSRDVHELLISLGETPTIKKGPAKLNGVEVGVRYRIHWTAKVNSALLSRKAGRFVDREPSRKTTQRRIMDVRPVPSVPVRCIQVDSPSHLYLAGETMIPTHNTESVKLRAIAFPFVHPGKGMLLTAPELNHLRPLTDEIEKMLLSSRIVREMMPGGKGAGIARQPHWQCRFKNGAQITSRLPNKDGKGVKGNHVINLELDEAQDYPQAGWREVVETLNAGEAGAMWRCHGVSRGVRDSFFDKTQPGSGWRVHRPMAMNRPSWSDKERQAKIVEYGGSRQSVDYRRNIYGEHGDAANSVFVLAKLMAVVDLDEGSSYNTDVYQAVKIEYERFPEGATDDERAALLYGWLDIPGEHFKGYSQRIGNREVGAKKGYTAYWGGMDVGVTNHPSEILIFGQRAGEDFLELLLRVQMHRVNTDDQILVVERLFELYGEKLRLGIDKTGVGFPLWDQLTRRACGARVYGFGFSEKRVVAFEDRPLEAGETMKDLAKYRNVVEASTDWLRNDYVDAKSLRLPYDREVLVEFQGQTYSVVRDNGDPYGVRRQFAGGSFHTLDAAKIAVATRHIPPLEERLEERPAQPFVLDVFMGA